VHLLAKNFGYNRYKWGRNPVIVDKTLQIALSLKLVSKPPVWRLFAFLFLKVPVFPIFRMSLEFKNDFPCDANLCTGKTAL